MRKLWLALACVLAWAGTASAQITLVGQDVISCGAGTSCQIDNAVTAQAGDLVVLLYQLNAGPGSFCTTGHAISDATNGSYTINAANNYCDDNNTGRAIGAGYFINSGAAALAPTLTWSGNAGGSMNFSVWRPTGTVTADQFNENETASGTSQSHGSITTTGQGLIITWSRQMADGGAETVATDFTALTNNQATWNDYGQYKLTTTGETTTAAYTTANSVVHMGVIASFVDSGGAGATCTGGLTLMGAGKCD